jgi:hypothetical protein
MSSAAKLMESRIWDLGFGIWEFKVMASAAKLVESRIWDLGFGNLK